MSTVFSEQEAWASHRSGAGVTSLGDGAHPVPLERADGLAIAAIVALWSVSAILAGPRGDFPLNDDWAYGLPVKWLVETGRLRFTDWQCMTLIAQVGWGTLFVGLTGFSFTALRISTLVLGAIGLAATYLTAREFGLPRWLATVLAGLLAVNPVVFGLSLTFLTDVPFWAITTAGIFFLMRGSHRGHGASLWVGWSLILAAALVRQVALAVPLGMVVALALKDGLGRSWLLRAVVPAALLFVLVSIYPMIVQATIGLPSQYYKPQAAMKLTIVELLKFRPGALKPLLSAIGCGLLHLGWWLLPMLLLLPGPQSADRRRRGILPTAAAGMAVLVTALLWATGNLMPLGDDGKILVDLGIGPRTLAHGPPPAPVLFWVIVTAASAYGASWIVLTIALAACRELRLLVSRSGREAIWRVAFLTITGVVYYGAFASFAAWFDRYLLLEAVVVGLLVAWGASRLAGGLPRPSSLAIGTATALALSYWGFAVVASHDYLAWNRARWEVCQDLMTTRHVTPATIDGGFEFNKFYYWVDRPGGTYQPGDDPFGQPGRGDEARDEGQFAVEFGERPGFTVLSRGLVDRWSPLSPGEVLVLERNKEPLAVPAPLQAVP